MNLPHLSNLIPSQYKVPNTHGYRSQCLRSLWCGSAASCLMGLRVRIPPGAWMSVSCECCVLSGIGLCIGLVACPEESY